MQGVWHVIHCGDCSCLNIKKCVSLVWPKHNQYIVTYSFLDFLKAGILPNGFDQEEFIVGDVVSSIIAILNKGIY